MTYVAASIDIYFSQLQNPVTHANTKGKLKVPAPNKAPINRFHPLSVRSPLGPYAIPAHSFAVASYAYRQQV
jgi:hypothetical protein